MNLQMVKLDITITGDLGSGKSTVAKALCQMLNFKYFSTGGIQRQIGKDQGMNTLELNYFAEKNLDIDKYIDDFVIRLNDEEESFAIDSRMAWHFIRNSFKIYLTVNPIVAAKRVMADCHRDSEQVMEDVYEKSLNLLERRAAEDNPWFVKKYQKFFIISYCQMGYWHGQYTDNGKTKYYWEQGGKSAWNRKQKENEKKELGRCPDFGG